MARIGRNVTFNGSRETIAEKMLFTIDKLSLADINFSFVDDNTINIYGEAADLVTLRNAIIARNFKFTDNGAAPPEPAPEPPEPPLDYDPAILRQAWENIKQEEKDALWVRVQAEYTLLGGTGNPTKPDIKWLR